MDADERRFSRSHAVEAGFTNGRAGGSFRAHDDTEKTARGSDCSDVNQLKSTRCHVFPNGCPGSRTQIGGALHNEMPAASAREREPELVGCDQIGINPWDAVGRF